MANKGGRGYIKRLNAPKYFAIHRKENKYVIRQNPGRHTLQRSIALTLMMAKVGAGTRRSEYEKVIKDGNVKVNGNVVKEPKYPVGLNDMVSVGSENYSINIDSRGHMTANKADKATQVYKVIGKYKYRKNQMMLRLHDGRAVKAAKDANVNDSVVLAGSSVSKVMKLDSGSKCEVIEGVHVGKSGTVSEIRAGNMHKQKSVIVEPSNGQKFETLVKNIIVVG